ncbi:SusC/RagA family TonB-linked outer membrane protein [Flavivirga spongiicola]|uniref:SusC/RagA family TonB-linked outer membrane protein n=1 Tax=Flavivirga spongiicola TaxID=421621 RepID=A0ABU7XSM5_9FLAO|nr:SusC/RagA family TonB-linked outer membrane protein [Flavivirga sp. MEBiC05379]MDO5977852.1 SusC/RagA family TonB-linked outer membrane protein [Flavivirga sp. MEBiC05379]
MKKKSTTRLCRLFERRKEILLLLMKRCLILSILFFNIAAFSYSQKITLELGKTKLSEAFKGIKKATKVDFFFSHRELDVDRVVMVNYKDTDVLKIVSDLVGSNFKVQLNENILLITPVSIGNFQNVIKVKGNVTDENGEVLPGATVKIKETNLGTTTDYDGNYTINTDEKSILVFSYVGYLSQEVEVNGQNVINIKLIEDISKLDEVVITGIVQRKRESFTGATQTFNREELKAIGNLNVIQSLKTLDPSFVIQENNNLGSNPNVLPDIEVRGKTSISTDNIRDEFGSNPNEPLFILDGFETTLQRIVDLDMNRVASITILKDASSTALYGAKAANGVIAIETLRPIGGRLQVTYNSDFRIEMPDLSVYNLMNSTQKLQYEKLAGRWSYRIPETESTNQFDLDKSYNSILAEIERGVDTYWLNEPVRVGTSLGHSLYIGGGENAISYGVGLNYKKLNGAMIGSDRSTWGADISLTYRKDKLNITNRLYINGFDANETPYGSFSNFANANPYFRQTDATGNITKFLDIDDIFKSNQIVNPLYNATLNGINNNKNYAITNNLQAIWTFNPKLRLQAALQLSKGITTLEKFLPPEHTSFENTAFFEKGSYQNVRSDVFSYKVNMMATYANIFKEKHQLTANLRVEAEETDNKRLGINAVGFPSGTNGNPAFSFSYKPDSKPATGQSLYRRINLLGSINYAFDNKYLFDGTYRLDGSTVFGSNQRYSPFWAVGAGWNLHNEFGMDPEKISMLKLRGNIGSTGNQGFGSLSSVSIYNFNQDVTIFGQTLGLQTLANPNLEWQKTIDASVGIDLVLFKNRLSATLNAFNKKTDPLVVRIDLPSSTGVFGYPLNTGNLNTKGVEAIIRYSPIYNPENNTIWTLGVTTSSIKSEYGGFRNTLNSLNDNEISSRSLLRFRDGFSPEDLWVVESLGIDPGNGQEAFLTKDGLPTYEYNVEDEKVMGNSRPSIEGVISSNLRLKNFTFGINFRYRFGGDVLNTALFNKVENISATERLNNFDVRVLNDRWINPGDVSRFKSITDFSNTPISSRFIQKENVIIGESINLGYEFKNQSWMNHLGLSQLRLNAYMNEIFRISSVRTERGIDYPFARAVSFSLKAYF